MHIEEIRKDYQDTGLSSVPEEHRSMGLCEIAIREGWATLDAVPERFRTEVICHQAVQVEGENIRFVPTPLLNKEICQDALSSVVRRWSMWINIFCGIIFTKKK